MDFNSGEVVLIDKHAGVSSFYIVKKIRGITRTKKVGHAGTLDPSATGLLIVCTGKKTKEISKYQDAEKIYSGTICLGKRTESMDGESDVIEEKPFDHITEEKIHDAVKLFTGEILQIPPMYSALKHKGKPLYKLARKGLQVDREPRKINISKFEITQIDLPKVSFRVVCSKGTYVRVLAEDYAKSLDTVGYLQSLRREAIGEFKVSNALTINEFEVLYKSK